jgi:hypothetical protein
MAPKSKHLANHLNHPGQPPRLYITAYQTLPTLTAGGQHSARGAGLNVSRL